MCSALLGRIHLSGHLDRMSGPAARPGRGRGRAYKLIRADLAGAVPFWPLGLPGWTAPTLALGMRAPGVTYVTAWRRPPGGSQGGSLPEDPPEGGALPDGAPRLATRPALASGPPSQGVTAVPEILYPRDAGAASAGTRPGACWPSLARTPSACVIRLRADRQG